MSSRTYGVVHGMASCHDCPWSSSSYKNIQAIAARHAYAYGHHVHGEVGAAFSYTGDPVDSSVRHGVGSAGRRAGE